MSDVTQILERVEKGDGKAAEELLPLVYEELPIDGASPRGGLVLSGSTLYGTTFGGTVFRLNTDGTGFTKLHVFTATHGSYPVFTNSDGAGPSGTLILSGNTLYGSAWDGGSSGNGTVFALNIDGSGFTTLHSFTATSCCGTWSNTNSDGAGPGGTLILSGNTLYGTAAGGGDTGAGRIFSISLPTPAPQLGLASSGPDVILTWPTNATGFTLQSTTNLVSPVWTSISPPPIVVNGQNTVTNPISGRQQFYRLAQ